MLVTHAGGFVGDGISKYTPSLGNLWCPRELLTRYLKNRISEIMIRAIAFDSIYTDFGITTKEESTVYLRLKAMCTVLKMKSCEPRGEEWYHTNAGEKSKMTLEFGIHSTKIALLQSRIYIRAQHSIAMAAGNTK